MFDNVQEAETFTKEETKAGYDWTGDNFLKDCAETINERYARAKAATRNSLEDLRVVGDRLNDAKEFFKDKGKGAFGQWVEAQGFPFDKTWRARLMKLAANWDAIMEAVEALPEDKRKWSVDGVLAIWAAAEKAKAAPQGDAEGEPEGEAGAEPKTKAKKETEAERLRRELAEALELIERLKKENAELKAKAEGPKAKAKAETKAKPEGGATVDANTKRRAKAVYNLYKRPGTEEEGNAAKERLEAMAKRFGLSLEDFIKACGLEA